MLLKHRVSVCLSLAGLLASTAVAQTSQAPIRQAAAQERPDRPAPQTMQVSVEMEQVLQAWEVKSAKFQRLQGTHDRYVYQPTVGLEVRATGQYFFEAPDRGRIDIEPVKIPEGTEGSRSDLQGRPMRVTSAELEIWVADGAQVLGLTDSLGEKNYSRVEIPPNMRGENVADGPLPFLFGISAAKMKARYRLEFGPQHNLDPAKGATAVHVVAYPTRPADAQNWQRAEVLLEPKYFLPRAIRLKDGIGQDATETVYVFNLQEMKANQKWHARGLRALLPGFDPFKPDLSGYKLLENHRVSQTDPRMQGK